MVFERKKALLRKPDLFRRFLPESSGILLKDAQLPEQEGVLVFERGGERRGLLTRQMVYHHVAQGELAGLPYVVTF